MDKNSRTKMTLPAWIVQIVIILELAVGSAGCASLAPTTSPTVVPSPLSPVEACEADKVPVTDVHWFRDTKGAWRVVGVISNHSSQAVGKLVTGVETKDKAGQPADQGEDVSAYPLNLQPGKQAPFIAWIDREIPNLDHFEVEVDECVLAEQAERGQVEVRGGRMTVDEAGAAQVTAELYNPGPKPVLVNGLMAGVYDQAGALIAADYAVVASRYLAPGENGPVRATLVLPPGSAGQIKSYQFFMDVLINKPGPLPLDTKHDVQIISRYIDKDGHFHLVGQITNPGSKGLMTSLQATVYADSKKSVVVDAAYFNTWIPLGPGETLPFDLTEWGALNNTRGLWDELAKQNAAIELRVEPFLTWVAEAKVAKLSLMDSSVSFKDQQAIFTGKAKAESSITTGLVTVVVRQKSNKEIVATGSAPLEIVGSSAPGQVLDYYLVISLPANVNPATVETEVTAMGQP
jgi:hypothetical protein